MQFQVPQFIESEESIVGPFSLRQFIYVGVAALASAMFYFIVQPWLFFIIAFILVGGALAISFVKINGRPLLALMTAAAHFYWRPQTYIWRPEHARLAGRTPPRKDESEGGALEKILARSPLHKNWEELQTGSPANKNSDKQFLERKMAERYQIFQRVAGDRSAARRVDYR